MRHQDLRLYELHSLSEMEKARQFWTRLVLNSQDATPFQSWEWNFGMAEFESHRVHLRIIVAEDKQGEVVGIAPFWIRSSGLPGLTILEFIGSHPSDYLDLIFLQPYKDAFVGALKEWIERNTEWRIIHLENLRWVYPNLNYRNAPSEVRPTFTCPYASLPKTVEEYEVKLSKNLRSTIRKQSKRLNRDGRLSFSISQTTSQLKTDLFVLTDLHQRRQRTKGERGRFFDERWIKTFQEISLMLHQADFLRLGTMRIDGQPAVCLYNLRMHGREYSYYTGMEPVYARHSPGTLIHYWMIGEAIKDGVQVYDFCRGSEPYKSWWTNDTCRLSEMTLARSKAEGYIWRRWESWRTAVYKSRLIKRLYFATVGRFKT
jgi:CelD/BcsL family acetyltransferase involved in cellulose biosynthesis